MHRFISQFLIQKIETSSEEEEKMVSLVSRTGRQFQRYTNKGGRQVVGCIPYRYGNSNNDLEVLVISSQKGGQAMLFPKGGWEIDESMEEAASRESLEEAGVRGNVEGRLGKWNFKSKRYDILYEGYMFPLLVKEQLDSWPEKDVRTRRWITVTEAREICQHPWMKEALERLIVRKTTSLTASEEEEEEDEECEDVLSPCSL